MKDNEKLDCPLCGTKGVIAWIPEKTMDMSIPSGGSDDELNLDYGSHQEMPIGGHHDCSEHAAVCPMLQFIEKQENKVRLLQRRTPEYVPGILTGAVLTDTMSILDYRRLFNAHDLVINITVDVVEKKDMARGPFAEKVEYITEMTVDSKQYPRSEYGDNEGSYYPSFTAKDPATCFKLLKDFFLCGAAMKVRFRSNAIDVYRWHKDHFDVERIQNPTEIQLKAL